MARPRKFDEAQVMEVVRDAFWSGGYAGTSVDAISAASGLGKGSLYGAFGDKRDLFLRVFDGYCTGVSESAERALQGPPDQAVARLAEYLRSVARGTAADTRNRGCLLAKGTAELAEHEPAVAERAREALARIEHALAQDVALAQRNGDIDPAVDPQVLAGTLLALTRGIEALGRSGADASQLDAIAEQAVALLPRPVAA